eukprot:689367-Pyramimonas_sp.AAC.1
MFQAGNHHLLRLGPQAMAEKIRRSETEKMERKLQAPVPTPAACVAVRRPEPQCVEAGSWRVSRAERTKDETRARWDEKIGWR